LIPVKNLARKYLRTLKREGIYAHHTLKSYESDLNAFAREIGCDRDILSVSEVDIERYFSDIILFKKYSNSSLTRKISTIRRFFQYLEFEDIIPRSPVRRVPLKINANAKKPVMMLPHESEKFFNAIRDELNVLLQIKQHSIDRGDPSRMTEYRIFCNIRNHLLFRLILETGIKPGEIASLQNSEVQFNKKHITIKTNLKNSRNIDIINKSIVTTYKDYARLVRKYKFSSPYFFFNKDMKKLSTVMIQKIFRGYMKMTGIKRPLTPSSLRHTYAINLIRNNTDMNSLKTLLGYKSYEGLLIYHEYFSGDNTMQISSK